jgi:glyoxylase-like metal-dependent hydrolase (beta-lactamase superfamily II)
MIDPGKLAAATAAVYGSDRARALYGELIPVAADRIIEAVDGLVLTLGRRQLVCSDSPGHAKHHIFVHDTAASGIFAGDTFGISYRELDVDGRPFLFPTTTPSQFDPAAMRVSVERMLMLSPKAIYLTHFGRLAPPQPLAADLLRRLDECVRIAHKTAPAGDNIVAAIREAITDYLLREARGHGASLPDSDILALWNMDLELNAQGLAHWAGRPSA